MRTLARYKSERRHLDPDETGLIVFDIDDTLVQADPGVLRIKKHPGGDEKRTVELTTAEFARDPDAGDPHKKSWFDFSDFLDYDSVFKSIIQGTPIYKNLRILDDYVNAGYEFAFLTARSNQEACRDALDQFLKWRDDGDGALKELRDKFRRGLSRAINDPRSAVKGLTDAEKKATVLNQLASQYDHVIFVDDDEKNLDGVRALHLPNLRVIRAHAL